MSSVRSRSPAPLIFSKTTSSSFQADLEAFSASRSERMIPPIAKPCQNGLQSRLAKQQSRGRVGVMADQYCAGRCRARAGGHRRWAEVRDHAVSSLDALRWRQSIRGTGIAFGWNRNKAANNQSRCSQRSSSDYSDPAHVAPQRQDVAGSELRNWRLGCIERTACTGAP